MDSPNLFSSPCTFTASFDELDELAQNDLDMVDLLFWALSRDNNEDQRPSLAGLLMLRYRSLFTFPSQAEFVDEEHLDIPEDDPLGRWYLESFKDFPYEAYLPGMGWRPGLKDGWEEDAEFKRRVAFTKKIYEGIRKLGLPIYPALSMQSQLNIHVIGNLGWMGGPVDPDTAERLSQIRPTLPKSFMEWKDRDADELCTLYEGLTQIWREALTEYRQQEAHLYEHVMREQVEADKLMLVRENDVISIEINQLGATSPQIVGTISVSDTDSNKLTLKFSDLLKDVGEANLKTQEQNETDFKEMLEKARNAK